MGRKVFAALSILLLSPALLIADSSFEQTKNGVARAGFRLFGAQISSIMVDSTGRVYAGANSPNGVFCSTDFGDTWSAPPIGTDLGSVNAVALGATPGTAYVIGGVKLFKTSDGCQTWQEITTGQGDYGFRLIQAHGVLLAVVRNGRLDRSTDGGTTFNAVDITSNVQEVTWLTTSPDTNVFYALAKLQGETDRTVYKSTDAGATWTSTGKSGDYDELAIDPTNGQSMVLGSTATGLLTRTTDGATWMAPISSPIANRAPALKFLGSRLYMAEAYTDNWSAASPTWVNSMGQSTSGIDLYGQPTRDGANSKTYVITSLGLARSDDDGATWVDKVNGLFGVTIYDIAQSHDKQTVFLATHQGVAKSSNFLSPTGPTWSFPISLGPFVQTWVDAIQIDRRDETHVFAASGGVIYRSVNGGTGWETCTISGTSETVDVVSFAQTQDGTLYAGGTTRSGSANVLLSSPDGATWTVVSGITGQHLKVLEAFGNTVFAGLGSDFNTDYVNGVGMYKYEGGSWSRLEGSVSSQIITDIKVVGTALIAASAADQTDQSGGVFRSADGGVTWQEVTQNGLKTNGGWYRSIAVDPGNTQVVYAAHGRPAGNAEIYISEDNGQTWTLYYQGLVDEVPKAMLVDGLMAGFNTGLFAFSGSTTAQPTPTPTATSAPTGRCGLSVERKCRKQVSKGSFCEFSVSIQNASGSAASNTRFTIERAASRDGAWRRATERLRTDRKGKKAVRVKVAGSGYYRASAAAPVCTSKVLKVKVRGRK